MLQALWLASFTPKMKPLKYGEIKDENRVEEGVTNSRQPTKEIDQSVQIPQNQLVGNILTAGNCFRSPQVSEGQ